MTLLQILKNNMDYIIGSFLLYIILVTFVYGVIQININCKLNWENKKTNFSTIYYILWCLLLYLLGLMLFILVDKIFLV